MCVGRSASKEAVATKLQPAQTTVFGLFLREGLRWGSARIRMREKSLGRRKDCWCRHFSNGHQGDAENDSGYGGYNAYVRYLAQPARRFILPIGVFVGRNLEQKYKREQTQGNGDRPGPRAPRTSLAASLFLRFSKASLRDPYRGAERTQKPVCV
jgi:hypothetical protein